MDGVRVSSGLREWVLKKKILGGGLGELVLTTDTRGGLGDLESIGCGFLGAGGV